MINRDTPIIMKKSSGKKKNREKEMFTSHELARNLKENGKRVEEERRLEEEFKDRMVRLDQISAELEDLERDSDYER